MITIRHTSLQRLLPLLLCGAVIVAAIAIYQKSALPSPQSVTDPKTEEQFKKILTPEQYVVLRQAGTETPFSGKLDYETRAGTYYSYGCGKPIFRSEQKYDSKTGWPSFWAPIKPDAVVLHQGTGLDDRTEVRDTCGSHLGHVFNDGPQPTGKRFCMNSVAMYFVPDKK